MMFKEEIEDSETGFDVEEEQVGYLLLVFFSNIKIFYGDYDKTKSVLTFSFFHY